MNLPLVPDVVKLLRLRQLAEEKPLTLVECNQLKASGDIREFMNYYTVYLPVAYKVTFTIEQQPAGWVRTLVVSQAVPQKVPEYELVKPILQNLGFQGNPDELHLRRVKKDSMIVICEIIKKPAELAEYSEN